MSIYLEELNYVRALNAFLPQDVRILDAKEVPEDFSARKSATSRVYRYFISFGETCPANNTVPASKISRNGMGAKDIPLPIPKV